MQRHSSTEHLGGTNTLGHARWSPESRRPGDRPAESCTYSWMPITVAKTPIAYVAECFIELPFSHLLH